MNPLFPFGFGLSYTSFSYGELTLSKTEASCSDSFQASVEVTNIGSVEGTEIVQLYIRDEYSSVTRPVKELKDFARVSLKPGESRTVTFTITPDKLALYNAEMKYVVEPGSFIVMAGPSSVDRDLRTARIEVVK